MSSFLLSQDKSCGRVKDVSERSKQLSASQEVTETTETTETTESIETGSTQQSDSQQCLKVKLKSISTHTIRRQTQETGTKLFLSPH